MAKIRKLVEVYWAIRVGTFKNSEPHFLFDPRIGQGDRPLKFRTRDEAFCYKRDSAYPDHDKVYWAIVRVELREL